VKLNTRGLSAIVPHPAWATVKRVTMLQAVAQKTLVPLFDASPSLVDAGILTEKITRLVALERLTGASLDHLPDRATLARFTKLESMTLEMFHPRDAIHPDEDALPATLTQLTLPYRITLGRGHFERLSRLKSLALKDKVPDDALNGCAALERLDTLYATPPALIEGLPGLRELRVGVCDVPMMAALLQAAPGLKRLEVYPSFAPAHLASMIAAFFSSPLESMGCGDITCTKDGLLETRYFGNPRVPQVLALLPKGAVKRVRYRPYYAEPDRAGGRAPDAARVDEVRATLAPFGVELEVAWH
jgi:hypothetical protein